jgi:hypothetical protein
MSKRINVNPDHYKSAGRERPGDAARRGRKPRADEAAGRARWERSRKDRMVKGRGSR